MGASALLDRLRAHGFEVELVGPDRVAVAPSECLTDALRAEIRAHKPALVAALAPPDAPPPAVAVGQLWQVKTPDSWDVHSGAQLTIDRLNETHAGYRYELPAKGTGVMSIRDLLERCTPSVRERGRQ